MVDKLLSYILKEKMIPDNYHLLPRKNPKLYQKLKEETSALKEESKVTERIYCLLNNIQEILLCECGNALKFIKFSRGYRIYCSKKCATASKSRLEKFKKTCLKNFQFDHPSKVPRIKERKKITCLSNYQVDNPSKSPIIKKRKEETSLEKFKVKHSVLSNKVIQKSKDTLKRNYNVEFPLQSKQICEGAVNTLKETYFKKFKKKIEDRYLCNFDEKDYKKYNSTKYFKFEFTCLICETKFKDYISNGKLPRCPKCFPKSGCSLPEKEIANWLKNLGIIVEEHPDIISPLEIDIYLPCYKIGIEHNGLYWHSQQLGKNKKYHLNKTNLCKEKEVTLLHIFENEWHYKKEIIKSIILNKIYFYEKYLIANKGTIREVIDEDTYIFLNKNHLQGFEKTTINLGLFIEDELLAILTLNNSGVKDKMWEIIRFCNKINYKIEGSFEYLLAFFEKKYLPNQISALCDLRYFKGESYLKMGFSKLKDSPPDYYYIHHHKLSKTNLKNKKLKTIWDCGTSMFIKFYQGQTYAL